MGYKGFKLICIKLTFYTLRIIILKIENDIYFNNFKIINMENEVNKNVQIRSIFYILLMSTLSLQRIFKIMRF